MKNTISLLMAFWASILLLGCASSPEKPVEIMTLAEEAVEQSRRAGAVQASSIEQASAEKNLKAAQENLNQEEYVEAKQFAQKAYLDAKLAEAKTQNAEIKASYKELQQSNDVLKKELNRHTNNSQ